MDSFGFGEVMVRLRWIWPPLGLGLAHGDARTQASKNKAGQILTGRRTAGAEGFWIGRSSCIGWGRTRTYELLDWPPAQTQREARVRPRQIEAQSSAACMPSRGPPGLRDAAAGLQVGDPFHCPVSVPVSYCRKCMHSDFTGSLHCVTRFFTHMFFPVLMMISSKTAASLRRRIYTAT